MDGRTEDRTPLDRTIDGAPALDRPDDLSRHDDRVEMTLHEERLRAEARPAGSRTVRFSKRIVTEQRQVTVDVRREVLVVEHLDEHGTVLSSDVHDDAAQLAGDRPQPGRAEAVSDVLRGDAPVAELVLHTEQVEALTRPVAVERVRVYLDAHTQTHAVTDSVRREVVQVEEEALHGHVPHEDGYTPQHGR